MVHHADVRVHPGMDVALDLHRGARLIPPHPDGDIGGTGWLGAIERAVDLRVAVDVVRCRIAGLDRQRLARPHALHVRGVLAAALVQQDVALGHRKAPALGARLDPDEDVPQRSVVVDNDGVRPEPLAAVKLRALLVCASHVDGPRARLLSVELDAPRDGRGAHRGVPGLVFLAAARRGQKQSQASCYKNESDVHGSPYRL